MALDQMNRNMYANTSHNKMALVQQTNASGTEALSQCTWKLDQVYYVSSILIARLFCRMDELLPSVTETFKSRDHCNNLTKFREVRNNVAI